MSKRSTSERGTKSKGPFQFKAVRFGDGNHEIQQSALPVSAELPFIVTVNGKTSTQDASLIKRTVMHDFVLKEKNQATGAFGRERARRSRKVHTRNNSTNSPDTLRRSGQESYVENKNESQLVRLEDVPEIQGPFDGAYPGGGVGDDDDGQPDTNLSPPSLLGLLDATGDPFNSYPVQNNSKLNDRLLDHFCSIIAPALIPLPFTNTQSPLKAIWARNTLTDATMFLGILLVAASHLEVLTGVKRGFEVLLYEAEIVRRINRRLDDTTEAISDSTICSVACLAACEAFRGNLHQLQVHMSGIQKMVSLRGGKLENLGMRGLVQMTVTWIDLTTAAMEDSAPHFPHVQCTNAISKEIFRAMRYTLPVTGRRPENAGELFKTPRDFPQIFENVQHLSLMLGAARETHDADYSSIFYFCNMRFYLENRLLGLPKGQTKTTEQFVRELTRLASLIFLHRVLREFNESVGVLKSLKYRLMSVFEDAEASGTLSRAENKLAETLLWILMCAGTVWLDEEDKSWFSKRIAIQVACLQFRTWTDVEQVLLRYLWIRNMCKEKCQSLWLEVEMIGATGPWMAIIGL